jgi:ABC-type phosphate transport system substrate-binding protein
MQRKILITASLLLFAGGLCLPALAREPFVLVVNAANPITSLSRAQASDLFLKKTTRWAFGDPVLPVDLGDGSPLRDAFSREVHARNTAAVKGYWQRLIFSGREVPPPEKSSVAEVLAYVRANRGAIAYLPAKVATGDEVKIVNLAN